MFMFLFAKFHLVDSSQPFKFVNVILHLVFYPSRCPSEFDSIWNLITVKVIKCTHNTYQQVFWTVNFSVENDWNLLILTSKESWHMKTGYLTKPERKTLGPEARQKQGVLPILPLLLCAPPQIPPPPTHIASLLAASYTGPQWVCAWPHTQVWPWCKLKLFTWYLYLEPKPLPVCLYCYFIIAIVVVCERVCRCMCPCGGVLSLWDPGLDLRSSDLHDKHFSHCIIMMAPSRFLVFCFVFETRSGYVAHSGLERSILPTL